MSSLGQQILKSTSPIVLSQLHDGTFQERDRYFNVDSSLAQSTDENLSFRYLMWFCSFWKCSLVSLFQARYWFPELFAISEKRLWHMTHYKLSSRKTCRWKCSLSFSVCRWLNWKSRPLCTPWPFFTRTSSPCGSYFCKCSWSLWLSADREWSHMVLLRAPASGRCLL